MLADREKWEGRYRSRPEVPGVEPAPFLREILPLIPSGRALDLAMGPGRNAVFLAANGWQVIGVDFSRAALEKAAALARQSGIAVSWANLTQPFRSGSSALTLVEADLEQTSLPANDFDLIVCFSYLQRSLFGAMERALRPGGALVLETYTLDQMAFAEGPHNPEYLLRPGELRAAFPSLQTLCYREFRAEKGLASLVARKAL